MQAKKLLLKPRLYEWSQMGYISPLPPLPPGSKLKTLATAKKTSPAALIRKVKNLNQRLYRSMFQYRYAKFSLCILLARIRYLPVECDL